MTNGGLGATHHQWRHDVAALVERIERGWPGVECNTYVGHPWFGWDDLSIDVWGAAGRGHPIPLQAGFEIRRFLMREPGSPFIRHTIYLHRLWTSFGGASLWRPNDHSGNLRHLHVTYWP